MITHLLKKQMTVAYQLSYVRLVLNYVALFETGEENPEIPKQALFYLKRLNGLIASFLSGREIEEELKGLRQEIISKMEVVTAYSDCFQNYEYVLNRLERKFKALPENEYGDEEFIGRVMGYVTQVKDSAVINSRIKEVIGQLPVRLTRQKFYSLVQEGLSVYIGSPRESLNDMMYILRSESMAELPKGMEQDHEKLFALLKRLEQQDYKAMTAAEYEEAAAGLESASEELNLYSQLYLQFEEILNDLYVLVLARPQAVIAVAEEELYAGLTKEVLESFGSKTEELYSEDFTDQLISLEGRQEAFYERYLGIVLPKESPALMQDEDYKKAVNIDRLLSGSIFAELITASSFEEEKGEIVDRPYLEGVANSYFEELGQLFSQVSKPVMRAVMARVLSELPVYFNSIDEVEAYIRGSIEGCLDEAEKEACKELLEELINDEINLV